MPMADGRWQKDSVMPVTKPWSSKGTLITKQNNPASNLVQGNASLQTDFPGSGNYTVEFLVGNQREFPSGSGKGPITPTAEVLWTLAGNTVRRLISIGNGVSITGTAEHVTVNCWDATDPTILDPQQQYDVTIMAARGVRGSNALPPTYVPQIPGGGTTALGAAVVGAASSLTLLVPENGGISSVAITAKSFSANVILTEADVEVQHQDFSGATLKSYDPRLLGFVPLSSQCRIIALTNFIGGGGASILFSVTFGIDG